jgi:hypothetical protein
MTEAPDLIAKQLSEIVDDLHGCTSSAGAVSAYNSRRIITRARAAIRRCSPPGSAYEDEAREVAEANAGARWKVEQYVAVVQALRDDYQAGALTAVEELVHADLFDDFLGMAGELLSKGFVGPSAVLAGTVLEEHLRRLAKKHDVATIDDKGRPRSVEVLGVDLRKAEVITEVQRRGVVAWYAQRSEGAHGRSENLDAAEVERMIDGIRDFVARYPA